MAAAELDKQTQINCDELFALLKLYGNAMPVAQLSPREMKTLFTITSQVISKAESQRIRNELQEKDLQTLKSLEQFC